MVREVERHASAHRGRRWSALGFTDLNDRASHPCGVFIGEPFSVFAKLDLTADSLDRSTAELRGLALVSGLAGVATPVPIATGVAHVDNGALLLFEALGESPVEARSAEDWRSIGRALAALHQVKAELFGLAAFDGYFGPLAQDNRPVSTNRWADFYVERRVTPHLRAAVEAGHLPPAPVFDAYGEIAPLDPDFDRRRELWRLSGYLAVIAVDGANPFGRRFLARLAGAIRRFA